MVGGKEKGAVKKKNSHGFPFPCRQGRLKGDNNSTSTSSIIINIESVGDTPTLPTTPTTAVEDINSDLIILDRSVYDSVEVTHLQVSDIVGGTLYFYDGDGILADEELDTVVGEDSFITVEQANTGLFFVSDQDSNVVGSFETFASQDGVTSEGDGAVFTLDPISPAPDDPVITYQGNHVDLINFDFSSDPSIDSLVTLVGDSTSPSWSSDVLTLVSGTGNSGAIVVDIGTAVIDFYVSVDLYTQVPTSTVFTESTASDGISFNYTNVLPTSDYNYESFDPGTGLGIRLSTLSYNADNIYYSATLEYNGTFISRQFGFDRAAVDTYTTLELSVVSGLASFSFGGQEIFEDETLSGWSPQNDWDFFIGAHTDTDSSIQSIDNLSVGAIVTNQDNTTENKSLVFSSANGNALSVYDADDGDTLTTTLAIDTGKGSLAVTTGGGAAITANNSASVIISGTAAQVNAALASVTYLSPANASGANYTSLVVTTVDSSSATVSETIPITVYDVGMAFSGDSSIVDHRVEFSDALTLNNHTVEAWVRTPYDAIAGGIFTITDGSEYIEFGKNSSGGLGVNLNSVDLTSSHSGSTPDPDNNNTANTVHSINTGTVFDGNWHHVAYTYSEHSYTYHWVTYGWADLLHLFPQHNYQLRHYGQINLYVDGGLAATQNMATIDLDNTSDYWLGENNSFINFNGDMAEVRVWDVARSASDIAASYDQAATDNHPNLVHYWRLQEGAESLINDSDADSSGLTYDGSGTKTNYTSDSQEWVMDAQDLFYDPDVPIYNQGLVDQTSSINSAFTYTFDDGRFTDPNGLSSAITYTVAGLPAGISFTGTSRTFSGTPTVTGSSEITITATDSEAKTVSASFSMEVESNPVVNQSLVDQVAGIGISFTYVFDAASFLDPGGDTLTYSVPYDTLDNGTPGDTSDDIMDQTIPDGLSFGLDLDSDNVISDIEARTLTEPFAL